MELKRVKYNRKKDVEFFKELKLRVDQYFKSNNKSRHADARMKFKTVAMVSWYIIPYIVLITGYFSNLWVFWGCWVMMGFGVAGIGLSVMHDANHGSYSSSKTTNKWLGMLLNLIGGYDANWKIQHNVLHHTYTNIEHLDEDIAPGPVLRFSPNAKHYSLHRFQHIYVWFFYSLLTLVWVFMKDFVRLERYRKQNLLQTQGLTYARAMTELIITKLFYFIYIFAIPIVLLPVSWGWIVGGFVIMHLIGGMILSLIFQPAHVIGSSEYYEIPEDGSMENQWAVHQLLTTCNFAPDSGFFSWYVGGLNYQVEHHLFPGVCHIHYKDISKIVKQVAKEYGIPYHEEPTFYSAVKEHAKMLKKLGKEEATVAYEPEMAA